MGYFGPDPHPMPIPNAAMAIIKADVPTASRDFIPFVPWKDGFAWIATKKRFMFAGLPSTTNRHPKIQAPPQKARPNYCVSSCGLPVSSRRARRRLP